MVTHSAMEQAADFATAEQEFMRAWHDPACTHIELAPLDVNRVLQEAYTLGHPLTFTRAMLWEVEVRKARDPRHYLPTVVQESQVWNRHVLATGEEVLLRASRQRQWLSDHSGTVLEEAHLNHDQQRVIFLGRAELVQADGTVLRSDERQPLFHVEHAVGGAEAGPLNRWRIVHLTRGRDQRLIDRFAAFDHVRALPEFIELYIRRDLDIALSREPAMTADSPMHRPLVDARRLVAAPRQGTRQDER